MGYSAFDPATEARQPWNAGRKLGAKRFLKPQQVQALRFWLDRERRVRDRAVFDLAIDSEAELLELDEGLAARWPLIHRKAHEPR